MVVVLVVLVVVVVVVVSAWITVVHFCCFRGLVFRSWGAGGGVITSPLCHHHHDHRHPRPHHGMVLVCNPVLKSSPHEVGASGFTSCVAAARLGFWGSDNSSDSSSP